MKNIKLMYIIIAALQITCFVLWFVPTLFIEMSGFSEYSREYSLLEFMGDATGWLVAEIVLLIIALIGLILPVVMNKAWKRLHLLPSNLNMFYSLFVLLVSLYGIIDTAQYYTDYGIEYGLKFMGYVFLTLQIITLVFSFVTSSKIKKIKKQTKIEEPKLDEVENV